MTSAFQFEDRHTETESADTLEELDVCEVSLVSRAANKRRFLVLKAENAPQEKKMTYAEIESMAADLVAKSAESMSTAQAVARLMERNPALYEVAAVEQDAASEEPSRPARTSAVFKAAHEASPEPGFSEFVARVFDEKPELAEGWYRSSMDNVDN